MIRDIALSQNVPQVEYLRSKFETFFGEGHNPSPSTRGNALFTPYRSTALDLGPSRLLILDPPLSATRHNEYTPPYSQPDKPVLDLPTLEGWKAELTYAYHVRIYRER